MKNFTAITKIQIETTRTFWFLFLTPFKIQGETLLSIGDLKLSAFL